MGPLATVWARLVRGIRAGDWPLRFSVVRHEHTGVTTWDASRNAVSIGSFDTFEAAIAAVDQDARSDMNLANEHWAHYLAQPPAKRRAGGRRR